ncbi:unnamed protein product [Clonostachys rosea]|uniref:SH3 domain-containing protein n=1 Tax=Bionectria ochroleuca TaxID=29856 RepID=A0ABY6USH1_BIOOC|nr:unnamed protein product [Clonostachys rosea]
MTRPLIVRADTIDLQNPDAPSAKNHGRQHLHPTESTAPHQASTLREVAHETAEEEARSPHLSWNSGFGTDESRKEEQEDLAAGVRGRMTQQEQEDQLAIAQNGGISSSDEGEDDGDLDDDMMDRISSSPSIEDEAESLQPTEQSTGYGLVDWAYDEDSSNYSENGYDEEETDDRQCAELRSGAASILATLLEEDEDEGGGDDCDDDDDIGSPQSSNDTDYCEYCYAACECLSIDSEDIDFDFVYALHTFVATVEGQANATKGDTMVLLDDSNSYWWLVRVVKDSSIGYLPAEHIETPTERLARWNKHRNVDLSAAMLGDNPQKQKSTLNKIRKRWKTVTFTEPTYVDYSDIDYSSDEEDIEELFGRDITSGQDQDQQQDQKDKQDKEQKDSQTAGDDDMVDERAKVEPLKTGSASVSKVDSKEEAKPDGSKDDNDVEIETRDSTELLGGHVDMVGRSRNGTMRNTDSFFKDDTAETKKITLTPNLLRDDLGSRPSTDSIVTKDKARPSLESKMDREFVSDKDKKKQKEKEKKEKEKKPSAIRSFFSRKDKKRTSEDDDDSSFGKRSMDVMSEPRQSEDPMADEQSDKQARSPGKPQKPQARVEPSLVRKNSTQKKSSEITNPFSETRTNDVSNVPPSTMRIVDPETQETREVSSNQQQVRDRSQRDEKPAIGKAQQPSAAATQPQRVAAAQSRMDLDDSDSSDDAAEALLHETPAPTHTPTPTIKVETERVRSPQVHVPGAFPMQSPKGPPTVRAVSPEQDMDRLSESPIEVSPISPINPHQPPGLMQDYAHSPSPEGSPSPDLVHVGEIIKENEAEAQQEPAWDDTKLRAFFDEGKHVRDLLAVVYDTSDVEPSDSSAGSLFREQNARLAEITTQLDNMLGDWLARKQRSRGTLL